MSDIARLHTSNQTVTSEVPPWPGDHEATVTALQERAREAAVHDRSPEGYRTAATFERG